MSRKFVPPVALLALLAVEGVCFAQSPSWCVPGTPVCAQGDGKGGVKVGGSAQGQVDPSGASGTASGNADAAGNASASSGGQGQGQGTYVPPRYYRSTPFGTGAAFCGTIKAGVHAGVKAGGCFALSFRWEPIFFEMETQLLFGGDPRSIDWLFPLSVVIPLVSDNLYEGLMLRAGGTPFGVTFDRSGGGRSYVRFGLHAGLTYEWDFSDAASWRVFDARVFLDFGTKRIDDRGHHVDYGGQLATGIVF